MKSNCFTTAISSFFFGSRLSTFCLSKLIHSHPLRFHTVFGGSQETGALVDQHHIKRLPLPLPVRQNQRHLSKPDQILSSPRPKRLSHFALIYQFDDRITHMEVPPCGLCPNHSSPDMVKLVDLPQDLLYIIFAEAVPHETGTEDEDILMARRAALIGLGRKIREPAERAAYRSISLNSHHAIRSLCRTLRNRPELAYAIREINLCSRLSAAYDESMVFFAFTSLLRCCIRITRLHLSVDGRHLFELTQLSEAIAEAPACRELRTLIYQTRSGSQAEIGCFLSNLPQLTRLELSSSFRCQTIRGLVQAPVSSLTFSSSLINSAAQTNVGGVLEALVGTLRSLTFAGTQGLRYSSVLNFFTNAQPSLDTLSLLGNFCNGRHPITTEEPAWEVIAGLCSRLRRLVRIGTGLRASARRLALDKLPADLRVLEISNENEDVWKQLEEWALDLSWLSKLEVLTYNGTDWVRGADGALVLKSSSAQSMENLCDEPLSIL
ncbi:hypothetical protein CROQUDRAFT_91777 [Cronartium quercuum f. sp. fusiforme G11]|uniref:Uncharacterized protein n=1 Tax=Cronartium quercuum f. sp. fusiforme G11 TaxID=708437 RepID=A0A9P6NHN2_9BASI|nr:hypothetical protein CROQUDRAFT_91777 [Cronartium quercuum f. sp. fusiforme G11]